MGDVLQNKKYRQVLAECNELAKGLSVYQWTLGSAKSVTMEQFWDCSKVDNNDRAGYMFTGPERCTYFEKELWLELVKRMWMNQSGTI